MIDIELPTSISELPTSVPLVAIHGLILMPRALLPVPLTESECHTLYQGHGYVGVLQSGCLPHQREQFFRTGCLGRVVDIETVQHRLILDLQGVCRFDVLSVTEDTSPIARVSYQRYQDDIKPIAPNQPPAFDRQRLIHILKQYFQHTHVEANWDDINHASDDRLIAALSMFCPLEAGEKQAVLEAASLQDQSQLIMNLLELSSLNISNARGPATYH